MTRPFHLTNESDYQVPAGMRSVSAIERFTGSKLSLEALPSQSAIRSLQGEKLLESFRVDLKKTEQMQRADEKASR